MGKFFGERAFFLLGFFLVLAGPFIGVNSFRWWGRLRRLAWWRGGTTDLSQNPYTIAMDRGHDVGFQFQRNMRKR